MLADRVRDQMLAGNLDLLVSGTRTNSPSVVFELSAVGLDLLNASRTTRKRSNINMFAVYLEQAAPTAAGTNAPDIKSLVSG